MKEQLETSYWRYEKKKKKKVASWCAHSMLLFHIMESSLAESWPPAKASVVEMGCKYLHF